MRRSRAAPRPPREVARRESDASQSRVELHKRELLGRVHSAFAAALYFDAALASFSNNWAGAQTLTRIARTRMEPGDALREDVARAEMEEIQARVEMNFGETARRLAMIDLTAALGDRALEIGALTGSLTNVLGLDEIEVTVEPCGVGAEEPCHEIGLGSLDARWK